MRRPRLPYWWGWPLEFPEHVRRRMRERSFCETDVRRMLFQPLEISASSGVERWAVNSRLDGRTWRIILEPDLAARVIVVVTAYPLEPRP